jgi:hypothetical protein
VPAPARGWSPAVFWTGATITFLTTAATIGSGVDTLSFRSGTYYPNPTTANYDTGVRKMERTNFLLAFSIAAGAFTGAAGLWLVDWHGAAGTRTSLVVVPGAIGLGGTFR